MSVKYNPTDDHGNCIFCKITSWEMPPLWWWLLWQDDGYMARLSPFPNTPWFTLVVPKKHYCSDVLAMDDESLSEFVLVAKKISKKLESCFDEVWRVWLIMEGTWIDHAHIKLIPLHRTWFMKSGERKQILSNNNSFYESYPGFICSNDWPRADDGELYEIVNRFKYL